MAGQVLLLSVGLSVGLLTLLLLILMVCCLWKRKQKKKQQSQYLKLLSTVPSVPACSAPVIPVSQGLLASTCQIPFTLPPRFVTQNNGELRNDESENKAEMEGVKTEAWRNILAHRGSLSVRSWYPVGSVLAGLYSTTPLNEVVAPPPGLATRLCFSAEYRHSSEQLVVSLLRLSNLPPRFHGNVTLVELRLLPDDRRPRQAKARRTGPDPDVGKDGKRHAVGRVLFPLEGELAHAGRVLWRDLEPEEDTQCSEVGDMLISLSYSSSLQRLSVVVLKARGLQLLTGAGMSSMRCELVDETPPTGPSLRVVTQHLARAPQIKRSCVVRSEAEPVFNHRMTFKLRPQHLDEACLRFELQQPNDSRSEPPVLLGALVLGPFMYARGLQLQHWMDMVNAAEQPIKLWHGLEEPCLVSALPNIAQQMAPFSCTTIDACAATSFDCGSPEYHEWMKSPELQQLTASEPLTLDQEYDMQRSWREDDDKCTFIILDKQWLADASVQEEQCMVGDVNIFLTDPTDPSLAELEIMIAEPSYRGKGIGKEVTRMMMCYGIDKLGVKKFQAKIGLDNQVSIAMFKKLHFQEVSVCKVFKEVTLEFLVDESSLKKLQEHVIHMKERDYRQACGVRRDVHSQ
ncbi:unnamed protein product [Menidia menidia]|uniref:(Atlantic silverside) hypothetical protein n=1 Tax=Menidia menidia TaxID=238744 RepID=A0A8S4AZS0_9TELE|nr:unnamed protein product [Menidia menidia]